jgi:hypothetical protein
LASLFPVFSERIAFESEISIMKSAMTERVYQEGTIYLYSINNEGLDKLNPARVTSVPTCNNQLEQFV